MRPVWGCCARANELYSSREILSCILTAGFFGWLFMELRDEFSHILVDFFFSFLFFPLFSLLFSFFELLFNSFLNHCSCSRLWESNFAFRDACYILYIYMYVHYIVIFFFSFFFSFFFPSRLFIIFFSCLISPIADYAGGFNSTRKDRWYPWTVRQNQSGPRRSLTRRETQFPAYSMNRSGKQNRIKTVPREASRSARMHFSSDTHPHTHTHLLIVTRFTHIHTT